MVINKGDTSALGRDFFRRDTSLVARELLGKMLIRRSGKRCYSGIIIETEAYYGTGDPASHASRGMTPRSRLMFGRPGIAYVYLCYGAYWLLNAVTEEEGTPGAVLIRGLIPLEGIEDMKKRRKISVVRKLTDGPGKLTVALNIDGRDNGKDMTNGRGSLYMAQGPEIAGHFEIRITPRIGIREGKDHMLRYLAVGL